MNQEHGAAINSSPLFITVERKSMHPAGDDNSSALTELECFRDADESCLAAPHREHAIIEEVVSSSLDGEHANETRSHEDILTTVASQFADATTTEEFRGLSTPLLPRENLRRTSPLLVSPLTFSGFGSFMTHRKYPLILFLVATIATLVEVSVLPKEPSARPGNGTKEPSLVPTAAPVDDRLAGVVACASQLSGHVISEHESPIRWKVVDYFRNGPGMYIDTADCAEEKSLFSTMYSMIVIRESLNVSNPSWNGERSYITDLSLVCRWKRVVCDRVPDESGIPVVTGLSLNNAGLYGTIPPEIKGLWGLGSLLMFSNPNLSGSLPSELGLLRNLVNLEIHDSTICGTVPTSLGKLISLREFRLYKTRLAGTMPNEVCSLQNDGNLTVLVADCIFVECTCCTDCK